MIEILLALVLLALVAIGFLLRNIDKNLERWFTQWGNNPLSASDYHAKEILKVTQDVAHYLALERRDKNEGSEIS